MMTETPLVLDEFIGPDWAFYNADTVEAVKGIPDNSIALWVQSPPFPTMYVYSNTPRDMGNCRDAEEFARQFRFLAGEMLRATMPGRNCWMHVSELLAMKNRDEYIGMKKFCSPIIDVMEEAGWRYYGECVIEKNPQVKASRSNDNTLLFKTAAKDAAQLRPALNDYMLLFHKDGVNPRPVRALISEKYGNPNGWITDEQWIQWANGIWFAKSQAHPDGIDETDVLQARPEKGEGDIRHLCPLQLPAIARTVLLHTNPGDIVGTAFGGIGSELYVSLKLGRKAWGCELKPEYFQQGCRSIKRAMAERGQLTMTGSLFDLDEMTT
jgi:DNA modification methylase